MTKKLPGDERYIEVAAALSNHAGNFSTRATSVTVPLYEVHVPREPKLIATGVLIAMGQARFLLTAGHAVDVLIGARCTVGVRDTLIPLVGDLARFKTPHSRNDSEDHFDIGVVRLSGPRWESIPKEEFLSLAETTARAIPVEGEAFAVIGFPVSQQDRRLKKERTVVSRAYRLLGKESSQETYTRLEYKPNVNLLLDFDKQRVWGPNGIETAPNPVGMSGGGIWCFRYLSPDSDEEPRLAAITIEWHGKDGKNVLIGTRIDQVLDAILDRYSDIRSEGGEVLVSFQSG